MMKRLPPPCSAIAAFDAAVVDVPAPSTLPRLFALAMAGARVAREARAAREAHATPLRTLGAAPSGTRNTWAPARRRRAVAAANRARARKSAALHLPRAPRRAPRRHARTHVHAQMRTRRTRTCARAHTRLAPQPPPRPRPRQRRTPARAPHAAAPARHRLADRRPRPKTSPWAQI
jgi:hypothetical protein